LLFWNVLCIALIFSCDQYSVASGFRVSRGSSALAVSSYSCEFSVPSDSHSLQFSARLDVSLQVRNRYNPKFDSKFSAGYRDLALKVKLGFEVMRFVSSAFIAARSVLPCCYSSSWCPDCSGLLKTRAGFCLCTVLLFYSYLMTLFWLNVAANIGIKLAQKCLCARFSSTSRWASALLFI